MKKYLLIMLSPLFFCACNNLELITKFENKHVKTYLDSLYVDTVGSYVSSEPLQGRLYGSQGDSLAMVLISEQFRENGLHPFPEDSYYWKFPVNGVNTYNLIGIKEGIDPLYKDSIIIVCAHHDHLGTDATGKAFNGASDNASGTSCMLLLAKKMRDKNFKRPIVFISTGAEEGHLYGMKAFKKAGLIPESNIKYIFNFDNLGKLKDALYVCGKNNNQKLKTTITNKNTDALPVVFIDDDWFRTGAASDHAVYNTATFPAVGINTGAFKEHHTVRDTWDKINVNGIVEIQELFYKVIVELANE